MPVSWFDELDRILTKVEDVGVWPDGLLDAYITMLKRTQVVFDCEGCVVQYARPMRTRMKFRLSPNKDLTIRLLNLNRVLLWRSVFRGEGSGNEDNFLNSGCCAGFRQAKFLLFPLLRLVPCVLARIVFPATGFFHGTARQAAEKSNVFLECVWQAAPILECLIWGALLLSKENVLLLLVSEVMPQMAVQMVLLELLF